MWCSEKRKLVVEGGKRNQRGNGEIRVQWKTGGVDVELCGVL